MLKYFKEWFEQHFSDPDVVTLFLLLVISFTLFSTVGHLLLPVLVAVVIAYLLEWPVSKLCQYGFSRISATALILLLFVGVMLATSIGLLPVIWQQGVTFSQEIPEMIQEVKIFLLSLPDKYPYLIASSQMELILKDVDVKIVEFAQELVQASFTKLIDLAAIIIYTILVPLMVFFMLKDKRSLMHNFLHLIPQQRRLINQVSKEMNQQIMNYIRGKIIEIVIVGGATYITLALFDMRYAALLSLLVGLSVLIPYIGAFVVTIPVIIVGLFQFGLSTEFWTMLFAYGVVQAIDGNLLVPILFSEAVDLNPVYIIVAILFFGGLWGFWGVFFAIPLASLVRAVLNAWSNDQQQSVPS